MTTDESALLAAIEANPADDLPRLVYADWLDEHGRRSGPSSSASNARSPSWRPRPRRSARTTTGCATAAGTARRPPPELLGVLAGLPGRIEVKFDRGFPARGPAHRRGLPGHGAALDAARPRPRVRVIRVAADVVGFLACPHLGCMTGIGGYLPGDTTCCSPRAVPSRSWPPAPADAARSPRPGGVRHRRRFGDCSPPSPCRPWSSWTCRATTSPTSG